MVWMSWTAIGSTPANGSSSSMNFGWVTSARVISSRRRSPPLREYAMLFRRCLMDSSSSICSRRSCRSGFDSGSISMMAITLSSTERRRNTDGSWARYPSPRRARWYIGALGDVLAVQQHACRRRAG